MRLLAAFVRHEAKTQVRSLRFRVLVTLYLVLLATPVVVYRFALRKVGFFVGASTFADAVQTFSPLFTAVLAAVLSVDGLSRERDDGSLPTVGLAPVSDSGYLIRRWLGLLAVILPITLVPLLVAASMALASGAPAAVEPFLVPWLLHTAPLAAVVSAFTLGMGTITGGLVSALVASGFVLGIGLAVANTLISRFHFRLDGPADWLGTGSIGALRVISGIFQGWFELTPATTALFDRRALVELLAPRAALATGLGALVLALSSRFLHRTRPDLHPIVVSPSHQLRTYVKLLNRLREEYTPDPAPLRRDLLFIAVGLALLLVAGSWLLRRSFRFQRMGQARYVVETSGKPDPTSPDVVPLRWRLSGEARGGGDVRTRTLALLRNGGSSPASHLAFGVNASVVVGSCTASTGEARCRTEGPRLSIELSPPLAPGESRELDLRLAGRPATIDWPGRRSSFATYWEEKLKAKFSADFVDFSRSEENPRIGERSLRLADGDLTPVPRYTTFELTPYSRTYEDAPKARRVPEEAIRPPAELEVDLSVPAGFFVSDSCGDVAIPDGATQHLRGGCRFPVADFTVRGERLVRLPENAGLRAVAVLPAHVAHAKTHLAALASAAELARGAWPGLDPLPAAIAMEIPPAPSLDPTEGMWMRFWGEENPEPKMEGRILLLEERIFARERPLSAEKIAAEAIARELLARRNVPPAEELFFRKFFRALALSRMGQGKSRAVVQYSSPDGTPEGRKALLQATTMDTGAWEARLPFVLVDLSRRVGERALVSGIEAFLAAGPAPGNSRELFERIGREAGTDLTSFHADFIAGEALPLPTFEKVEFLRTGATWETRGVLRNTGSGEIVCPVVVSTEAEAVREPLRVGGGRSVAFVIRSSSRPRVALIDPDGDCYRNRPKAGVVDRVENRGTP